MTDKEKLEAIRNKLKLEADQAEFEWNFVNEIVLIAKEMGVDTDDIMGWTIMKFNIVRKVIAEYYERISKTEIPHSVTLG